MRLADREPTGSRLCAVAALSMLLLLPAGGPAVAALLSPPRVYPTVEVAEQRRVTGPNALTETNPPLIYHGGPVGVTAGTPKVYLVFWGSQWGAEAPTGSLHFANDSFGVAPRLVALFNGLGTNGER